MKLVKIDETQELFESSMSRIISHLDTNNIATITSFITDNYDGRPKTKVARNWKQNRNANKLLSRELQNEGYGFIKVKGKYVYRLRTGDEPAEVFSEESYFVICPSDKDYQDFVKDMVGLAKNYEQESVIIWNRDTREAEMYSTFDYEKYEVTSVFHGFRIDKVGEKAWTQFKKNHFSFSEGISEYSIIDVDDTNL